MIKPVRKVKIIVPEDKKEEVLIALQKESVIMLSNEIESNELLEHEDELIGRAEIALNKLSSYRKKSKLFFEHNTVKYENFVNLIDKRINILEDLEKKFDELNFLLDQNKEEEQLIKNVKVFKDLEYTTKELFESIFVSYHFGYVTQARWDFFTEYAKRDSLDYIEYTENDKGHHILLYADKEELKKITQAKRFGFEEILLPKMEEKISDYIKDKEALVSKNLKMKEMIESSFYKNTDLELELKILVDQLNAKKTRKIVKVEKKDHDIVLNGWISEERVNDLQKIVKKVTLSYQLEFEQPTEYDEVPTLIKNNKFVTPFESITNTYSVPSYRELDPNPLMSVWYWVIFGLIMGDIGYGIIMVILFGLYKKYKKPKGEMGELIKIFYYTGFSTIIGGVIYGSLFGVSFDILKIIGNLFNLKLSSTLLKPIDEPIAMLLFSVGLGSIHIISGLVMKVIVSIKEKDIITGFEKGVSWILILLGLISFALSVILKVSLLKTVAVVLIILGVLTILVAGGIRKETVLGKIFGGFSGLTSITSYLSDLLSYSRILALALSTAIIAFTMNLLAGLIQTGILGYFLSIFVYLIGHVFNLAIGLLSAYVHNNRLQYLEFYGKFYEGGGYLFKPLRFNTKYINEIK